MNRMKRDLIFEAAKKTGSNVDIYGWVNTRRDHGKIIFLDIRDTSGVIQVVVTPKNEKAYKVANDLSSEDVVHLFGKVGSRPEKNVNPDLSTGKVEISAESIELISKAKELPLPIDEDGYNIEELVRYKYRYIDLRRKRLQENLRTRHKITKNIHTFLDNESFIEVETPYLSKTTPEGARDFIVPSRMQKGKFYALTQAPQQYKQLLMIAGIEKYYQIARAFRDEDLRADRQFEHTQIDIEMAFVERDDVLDLVERMVVEIVEKLGKKIEKKPFPKITYAESMSKYKTDKPNLNSSKDRLAFVWVVDFPLLEKEKDSNKYTFSHNPFTAPYPEEIEKLKKGKGLDNIKSLQYDLVCNGMEIGSGSIRITDINLQKMVLKLMGYTESTIEDQFGHLINAYSYGAPPHGGIALGLDRITALIAGEENIREVIAFPVSSSGQTSIMDAPDSVDPKILSDLGLKKVS